MASTPDELVVHQQDIQAVVNALWAGGAQAMTIQGQRVISTTGIKCVGNTVMLHGVPYSPPYRIAAIGNVAALQASLDNSDYVDAYLTFVDDLRARLPGRDRASAGLHGLRGHLDPQVRRGGQARNVPTRD